MPSSRSVRQHSIIHGEEERERDEQAATNRHANENSRWKSKRNEREIELERISVRRAWNDHVSTSSIIASQVVERELEEDR